MKKFTILLLFCIGVFGSNEPFNYDPFVVGNSIIKAHMPASEKAQSPTKNKGIAIGAIMTNRAFINGHWYSIGDKFGSYRVSMIKPTMVGLRKNGKTKIYYLGKKQRVLTIKERL